MAKKSKNLAPKPPAVPLDCCSMALDIVFEDPDFTVTATPAGRANSVRVSHPTMFYIPGLGMDGVNKGTTPWQIFIVPGDTSLPLKDALKSARKRKRRK